MYGTDTWPPRLPSAATNMQTAWRSSLANTINRIYCKIKSSRRGLVKEEGVGKCERAATWQPSISATKRASGAGS